MDLRRARTGSVGLRKAAIVGSVLATLLGSAVLHADTGTLAALDAASHVDAAGRLQMDVHFDCALAPPIAELGAAGLLVSSSVQAGTLCVVEGWAPRATVSALLAVPGVVQITAPTYPLVRPPAALRSVQHATVAPVQKAGSTPAAIDQNGITIMRADQFLAQTGVSGAGITVGVQSSGVSSLTTIQARGELPAVQVVNPASGPNAALADEGTALLEEVHAVAPGAKLVFCGPTTFVDYASCLSQLAAAGATIVLDDIGFASDGLMSLNNDQTSAINQFLSSNPNVMMFTSAGNNDGTYWEGNYTPLAAAQTTLPQLACPSGSATPDAYVATFAGSSSETLTVLPPGSSFPLLLAWADPPGQITSQFDVYWIASGGTTPLGCFTTAGSTSNQFIQYVTLPAGTYTLVVASPTAAAAGKFLKLWAGGDGLTTLSASTSGGLISPQHMATNVMNVGAVNGSDGLGNLIETFSSTGPLTVEFPTPQQLPQPTLVAPDGIVVDAAGTYFSSSLFPDGNFYGTSASVPNAAAVAALLRSAYPTLSVAQTINALQKGATALGTATPNNTFGYGRVDALGALGTLAGPTISALANQSSTGSLSSTPQALTVSGTGSLNLSVSSTNPALVPGAVVSNGSPGVILSSSCGSTTLSCTIAVQPAMGQAGTATLTITVLDGANRSAASKMTFTETDPASNSVTVSASSTPVPTPSSGGGGGELSLAALLWLAALGAGRVAYRYSVSFRSPENGSSG